MIDYASGYEARYRLFAVDQGTWADSTEVGGVVSMTLNSSTDGVMQKGSMTIDVDPLADFPEGYYRMVMTATAGGVTERVDVATVYAHSTGGTVDHGNDVMSVTCSSVLYPASLNRLVAGDYAPKGVDGVSYAASILRKACKAPVVTQGSFVLGSHVVFDLGSTALDAVRLILDAGSYCMMIGGDGTISLVPIPTEPSLELDNESMRMLQPGIQHKLDWSSVPNRYIAKDKDEVVIVTNDDPNSPTSTVTRGFVHDVYDTSPKPVNGETLNQYARRKLAEASVVRDTRTYKREWWPGVAPYSVVRGSIPSVRFDGDMRVKSQQVTIDKGIVVQETAELEVSAWQ